jgi:hypothetical protein
MMRAKQLIEKFYFGVIHREHAVVIKMIFTIKKVAYEARGRKTTVIGCTIVAMKNKVQQMNREVRWKEENGHAE